MGGVVVAAFIITERNPSQLSAKEVWKLCGNAHYWLETVSTMDRPLVILIILASHIER